MRKVLFALLGFLCLSVLPKARATSAAGSDDAGYVCVASAEGRRYYSAAFVSGTEDYDNGRIAGAFNTHLQHKYGFGPYSVMVDCRQFASAARARSAAESMKSDDDTAGRRYVETGWSY